jgi:hypothetical protein
VDKNNGKTVVIPKVGMPFKSEDDTYEMYNSYARVLVLVLESGPQG